MFEDIFHPNQTSVNLAMSVHYCIMAIEMIGDHVALGQCYFAMRARTKKNNI